MKRIRHFQFTILIYLLGFFTVGTAYTQVYINNENSDSAAILEIVSTEKGFLIPRLDEGAIDKISANGLLMFNTDTNYFNYYEDTILYVLNPWRIEAYTTDKLIISNSDVKVGIGITDPTATLEVNGSLKLKVFSDTLISAENGTIIFVDSVLQIKSNGEWKVLYGMKSQ